MNNAMKTIRIETDSYNTRHYGRPWIARVTDWPVGGPPELEWSGWVGQDGKEGRLEIVAAPGDIIRWGQKDRRGNGTEKNWGVVQPDGSVVEVDPTEACAAYDRPQADREALKPEADSLRARLTEIEALLAT